MITEFLDKGRRLDIVNLSLSGPSFHTTGSNCDTETTTNILMNNLFGTLRDGGVLSMASAGNTNESKMRRPACLSNVFSVGASDDQDNRASFTNSEVGQTDVFAPGVDILAAAGMFAIFRAKMHDLYLWHTH